MSVLLRSFSKVVVICFFCASCQKHYVNITRLSIGKKDLASSFVHSPDPRRKSPPKGEQLVVEWNLPIKYDNKQLILELSIIYKNGQQETIEYEFSRKQDDFSYFILGEKYQSTKGVMTYKAKITTLNKEVVKEWKESLWVNLIDVDQD